MTGVQTCALPIYIGAATVDGLDLRALWTSAERRLREISRAWDEARGEEQTRRDLRQRVVHLREELEFAGAQSREWTATWSPAAKALGLAETASTAEAFAALDVWKAVPASLRESATRAARITRMQTYIDEFEAGARALASELAPDLLAAAPADAIDALQKRLAAARSDEARRVDAAKQIGRAHV